MTTFPFVTSILEAGIALYVKILSVIGNDIVIARFTKFALLLRFFSVKFGTTAGIAMQFIRRFMICSLLSSWREGPNSNRKERRADGACLLFSDAFVDPGHSSDGPLLKVFWLGVYFYCVWNTLPLMSYEAEVLRPRPHKRPELSYLPFWLVGFYFSSKLFYMFQNKWKTPARSRPVPARETLVSYDSSHGIFCRKMGRKWEWMTKDLV